MQSDLQSRLEECQLSMATRGQFDERLSPHLWEQLRQRLQKIYRKATGEPMAVLSVDDASPSPISADAVVEACAKEVETWFRGPRAKEIGDALRALKGTFPAAPEAKSEVAGWVVLRKRGDGIFMSAETYDEASAAAEADVHDRGYFAVSRLRSALVDPEGGV